MPGKLSKPRKESSLHALLTVRKKAELRVVGEAIDAYLYRVLLRTCKGDRERPSAFEQSKQA